MAYSNIVTSALLLAVSSSCLDAQPGRKSQLATVSQVISGSRIEIVYRRPVARGRELFGKLVPYGRIWTPSADSAARVTISGDIEISGQRLKPGQYAMWMIPDSTEWTVVFSSVAKAFHLSKPAGKDEVLRVKARPRAGDHMESLGFYFPMADADSATLVMHWGKTIVPMRIRAR